VVDERAEIVINGFRWTERTLTHLAEHEVTPADVLHVRRHDPLAYRTSPGAFRFATHALVGRDRRSRSLIIFLSETEEAGIWQVHTAYRARLAHELLEQEGRL
jgi:hypothetical protein